jgi:UrcA family protein
MNKTAIKSILTVAALTLTAGISINASAESMGETLVQADGVRSESVSFSRAELSTDEGRASVERRIHKAAEGVCGPTDYREVGSLSRIAKSKACYDQAVAQAMSQVDAGQIAAID